MNILGTNNSLECKVVSFHKGFKSGHAILECEIKLEVTEECALKGGVFTYDFKIYDSNELARKRSLDELRALLDSQGIKFESIEHCSINDVVIEIPGVVYASISICQEYTGDNEELFILKVSGVSPKTF